MSKGKKKKKTKIAYNLKQEVNSDHLKWEIVFYGLTLVEVSMILPRALELKKYSFLWKVLTVFL